MKKIVLYGAFDRYNYGDNIMPILFEMFVRKYSPSLLDDYSFEYASISQSNLEKYCCYKTNSINSLVDTLPAGSSIIVIGGEVLCARNNALFMHMQNSWFHNFALKVFRKLTPALFKRYATQAYSAMWEFPYLPLESCFSNNINVIYNTVGGDLKNLAANELTDVKKRLARASYISVRDERTLHEVNVASNKVNFAPDSAYIMADLATDEIFTQYVRKSILELLPSDYIVLQAAPSKVGCGIETLAKLVASLHRKTKKKVVLLPIGYASGHDDYYLLKKIHKLQGEETVLLHDLNVWEIMHIIKCADIFFGTSLHGVITAMSFGVPHFGINPNISKLQAFLQDWSVAPYNTCYDVKAIDELPEMVSNENVDRLKIKTASNIEQVKNNNLAIINTIMAN